mgnify:CR=1 FL=1
MKSYSNYAENNSKICYVCLRITSSTVLDYAFKVWSGNPRLARRIGGEACRIIRRAYFEKPWFFCGKTRKRVLSGLFYLLGWKHDARKTIFQVADAFDTTEPTVRNSYRMWLREFPWLRKVVGETLLVELGLVKPERVGRPRNGKAPSQIREAWRRMKEALKKRKVKEG